jgi:cytochrome P450
MDALSVVQQLMTPQGRTDPYPIYRELREHNPVLPVGEGFVVVSGYAAADQVLRDAVFAVSDVASSDRAMPEWRDHSAWELLSRTMLLRNPPDHGRLRRLAGAVFTARRVETLRAEIDHVANRLLDEAAERSTRVDGARQIDFMDAYAYPLPVSIICALMGVPESDRAWFRPRATDLTLALEAMSISSTELARADTAASELSDYFVDLLAQRRRQPGDDMISDLLAAGSAGEVTGSELIAHLALLLVAGFETTTNLLGNGLAVLMAHPDLVDRLRKEPDQVAGYVAEMLRHDPPVQVTSRYATRAAYVGDLHVPAGTEIMVLLGAANRDPERFPDPDTFDPGRIDRQSLSFGAGAHYCLGAPLARLEAQVSFPLLLQRMPGLRPAGSPKRRDRLAFRGFTRLPIAWDQPAT